MSDSPYVENRGFALAIDPHNPNVVYAGACFDTVLYWSTDGGQS
jgi:hypothetical protein